MATSSTYYLNGPSLDAATAVFLNASLSVLAPDGFYSDGVTSREQVGGVLLPPQLCGECPTALLCDNSLSIPAVNGVYSFDVNIGEEIGVIVVRFNPNVVPDGIQITYDGVIYNEFFSQNDGFHSSVGAVPVYIGDFGYPCVLDGSPHTLTQYTYNGTVSWDTGGTESVSIISGQLSYTDGPPGECVFLIPKYSTTPSLMSIEIISPCEADASSISVDCPAPLPEVLSTGASFSQASACAGIPANTYFYLSVNGTPSLPAVNDVMFTDSYGTSPVTSSSYYKLSTGHVVQVGSNGVIINVSTCP